MQVDVIMPTIGRTDVLPRAIRSVIAQTYRPMTLYVIGDGVDRGLWHRCSEEWQNLDVGIEDLKFVAYNLPDKSNDFGATPRNWAIQRSKSSLIAYIDDDDEWLPDHLEIAVEQISWNDGPDITFGGYNVHLPCGKVVPVIPAEKPELGIFAGVGMVHSRAAISKLGQFPWKSEDCHDYKLIQAMIEKGAVAKSISRPVFNYFISSDRFEPGDVPEGGIDYCKVSIVDRSKV